MDVVAATDYNKCQHFSNTSLIAAASTVPCINGYIGFIFRVSCFLWNLDSFDRFGIFVPLQLPWFCRRLLLCCDLFGRHRPPPPLRRPAAPDPASLTPPCAA